MAMLISSQTSAGVNKPIENNNCESLISQKADTVPISRFDSPPTIDGRLDEVVWKRAARLTDFYQTQPGDNIAPTNPTEVIIGYDSKFLYLGIHAVDNPGKIRATLAKRDDITRDDTIAIYLDTFNDQRRSYLLMFNPLGVQQDGIYIEGREIDFSVDIVMRSKGMIVEDGYSIEVEIPFKSIRYEIGEDKAWGIHVLRQIKYLDEENSWMPLCRDKAGLDKVSGKETRARFLAQAGYISNIVAITAERTLDMIPVVTFSETGRRVRKFSASSISSGPLFGDSERFVNEPLNTDLGLTGKLRLTSSITLDSAWNADFAEVEADQPQITANQRFPLFFEEKRPFFLENIEIFRTPLQSVYSRTIVDPDLAIKLSGKSSRTNFGLMLAGDNAPGNFSEEERSNPVLYSEIERFIDKNAYIGALRISRDVGDQSNMGMIATSYNFIDKHNHLAGVDGRISLRPNTFLTFQLAGTNSRRYFYSPAKDQDFYRTGNGFGYFSEISRTGRHFNVQLAGEGYTPDYRTDVGFTQRTNINRWSIFSRYNSEPREDSLLISWSLLYTFLVQGDWQGRMNYSYYYPRILLNFKRQTFLNFYFYRDYARLFEEEFGATRTTTRPGSFVGAPERSTVYKGLVIEGGTAPSKKYSFNVSVDVAWDFLDFDFGAGPKFPRVSPAALDDPDAPLDPGPGRTLYATASVAYLPTDAMRFSFDYTKSFLVRNDTKRLAFDQNLYTFRANYSFTRFIFARARLDYDTLKSNVTTQLLFGYAPNPGTAFYIGYNDDLNYNGFNTVMNRFEPNFRRNKRTLFIKMSYLLRHGF
ncbi:carbohydrate binding family 9 domain-containing protein [bacterium]|nr:carbohydrate binding family 9 domain-containing protein [bacterium]